MCEEILTRRQAASGFHQKLSEKYAPFVIHAVPHSDFFPFFPDAEKTLFRCGEILKYTLLNSAKALANAADGFLRFGPQRE